MKYKYLTSILLCLSITAAFSACQASEPSEAQLPSSETSTAPESSAETSPEETTTTGESTEESTEAVEERNKSVAIENDGRKGRLDKKVSIGCQMWVKKHTFGSLSRILHEFILKLDYKLKELCNFALYI